MISSNSFLDNDLEDISAHCFRATLAVNKYKEGGAFFAQEAFNHKKVETTIISSFNFFDYKERLQEDSSSNDEEQEEENIDITEKNKFSDKNKELLFSLDYSNLLREEKTMFLGEKRKFKDILMINNEINSNKNLFESILDNSKQNENKQVDMIKNTLKESNRLFIPIIEAKRNSYLSSEFIPENIKQNEYFESNEDIIKNIIIKNRNCIFDSVIIKNLKIFTIYMPKKI